MIASSKSFYWKVFRLIFVIFSLYLMGDAFYRYDGFRYHSSFSEFIPSVSLVSILWSIVAILMSCVVWLLVKAAERLLQLGSIRINVEQILLFFISLGLSGVFVLITKPLIFGHALTSLLKILVVLCVFFVSVFLTWLFRHTFDIIQERITPLVWLFGIVVAVSILIVGYTTWWKKTTDVKPQKVIKSSHKDLHKPNILLITFDALTADNMSLYGYYRLTTPFFNKWAREATVFSRVEAESNLTIPTIASLMSGKRVWTHQLYHHEGSHIINNDTESLPLLLEKDGYTTMAFILNQMHASPRIFGISENFHIAPPETDLIGASETIIEKIDALLFRSFFGKIRFYDWIIHNDFIVGKFVNFLALDGNTVTIFPPQKAFNSFLNVIDNKPQKPFFAWIHLYPPHHPYLPPKPYMGLFDSSPEFRTEKSQDGLIMISVSGISRKRPDKDAKSIVNTLRARYDEFIRFSDHQLGEFIEELQKRKILKDTIVILSADHGEGFEHKYVGHGSGLYEEQIRIPLIIKEPEQCEGRVIEELTEQIDITATILDFAKIQIPSWIEGRSLVPLLRGERLPARPVFSMSFPNNPGRGHQITKGIVAVWEGDYKLIHFLEEDKLGPGEWTMLFNLKQDPDETNNLFNREQKAGENLLSLIKDNLRKANEQMKIRIKKKHDKRGS